MLRMMIAASLLLVLVGCDSECDRMRQCCAAVADQEWVGDACGSITQNIKSARACAAVTDAIKVAAQERKQEVPAVCQ